MGKRSQQAETISHAGRRCRQAVLACLVTMVLLAPLCFTTLFLDYSTPKLMIVETFTVLAAVLWIVGMARDGEIFLIDTSLHYTLLGFLAVNFISLFQAYNTSQGLDTLFEYFCYLTLAVVVFHTVHERRHFLLLAGTMVLAGGVVAVIGLLQYNDVASFSARWSLPISTIGNVNFVAEYYDVVFPISLAMFFLSRNSWLRLGVLLSCFCMACHLLVLGSRGGWLGAAVAVFVLGGVALLRHFQVGRRIVDATFATIVILGLGWPVMGGLLSGIHLGPERNLGTVADDYWQRVVSRTGDALRLQDHSSQQRVNLWEDTLRLIFDRPLVGVGVGNFEYNIPKYMSRQSLQVKAKMEGTSGQELMAFRAHNEYLDVWAETGILGFGVFCFLVYQIMGALYGLLKRYLRGEEDFFMVGLAAAVTASLAHSFFSTNLQDPASALHFWIAVGMVWSLKLNAEGAPRVGLLSTEGRRASRCVILTGGVVLTAVVTYEVWVMMGEYHYQRGYRLLSKSAFTEAVAQLDTATRYHAFKPFAVYQALGFARYREKRWGEAAQAFQRSLRYHPNNATVYYHLGLSLGEMNRFGEALPHFRRATALHPLSASFRLAYGQALGKAGDPQAAVDVLQAAVRLEPDADAYHALGANYGQLGNMTAAIGQYEKALALKPNDVEILNSLGVAYVRLGVTQGEQAPFQTAREIFLRLSEDRPEDPSYRVNLGIVLLNLEQPQAALDACVEALRITPDFSQAYAVIGSIYVEAGDLDRAQEAYREALRNDPGNQNIQRHLKALEAMR